MKLRFEYKVWITDTDGSERLGCKVMAASEKHARVIAKALGVRNISSVEIVLQLA